MSRHDIREEFERLGQWVTRFNIGGNTYGGSYDAMNDVRVEQFFQCFPNVRTVLELGSLEGGHTIALAKRPHVENVTSIEGREANIEKARYIQRLFGVENVRFVQANLEEFDLTSLGQFDAVFCVGLLYHLPEPWRLLSQITALSRNLFLWTHYAKPSAENVAVKNYCGLIYREGGLADPLSGISAQSFWPTLDDLKTMIQDSGLKRIQVIEEDPAHQVGPAVTLAASSE